MKVRELIQKLQGYDGNFEVVLSSDPEGNKLYGDGADVCMDQLEFLAPGRVEFVPEEYQDDPNCVILYPR